MPDFSRPSTFTPFLRRFTNERSRELDEAYQHYVRVKAWQDAFRETDVTIGQRVFRSIGYYSDDAYRPLVYAMHDLIDLEGLFVLPEPAFDRMNMAEFVEFRNILHRKEHFVTNQVEHIALLEEGLVSVLSVVLELPATEAPTPFTIPFVYALPRPREAVEAMFSNLASFRERGLFLQVTFQLYLNLCAASGRDPNEPHSRKPFIYPTKSELPLDELVDTYLAGTPFRELFLSPVPLKLSHQERFNHVHIIGGTGAGKTTMIENLILYDLKNDDPPSLVVIDPHSDLIRRLTQYDLGLDPIIIDPRDTKHPVALNPLAVKRERMDSYDEATREQVTAGVIQTFGYLWSGLTNLNLTGKQETFFRYVTRLLLTLPEVEERNATILDMLGIMKDLAPYERAITRLPPIARDFFETDFKAKTFEGTREQIRYRIQAIIENPTMARLFTAQETKVDFFTELNRGSVILVDTAKDFLKEGSAVFGKLMISLILQAVLERAAVPEARRKPTFLLVDEAGSFFSQNIDDLLVEARKYRCGLVLAHQYLDQATGALKASLAANTGTKFASGLSAGDARAMAPEMRTTADFILSQPRLHFAAHIRNVTPQAVSIPVHVPMDIPTLSASAHADLLERNRRRVSLPLLAKPEPRDTTIQASPPPPQPDEDISCEW